MGEELYEGKHSDGGCVLLEIVLHVLENTFGYMGEELYEGKHSDGGCVLTVITRRAQLEFSNGCKSNGE